MQELISFAPYIVTIAFVEIILSFDNALLSAALADEFSGKKRKRLLQAGVWLGAFFRILALFLMAIIIKNPWLKLVCGLYLIGISVRHIALVEGDLGKKLSKDTYTVALFQIAIADRVFGIQNMFTLSSFHVPLFVIASGVIIGLIGFSFATKFFASVINKYKGLQMATFSLAFILGVLMALESFHIYLVSNTLKLLVISFVYLFTLLYEHNTYVKKMFTHMTKKPRKVLGHILVFIFKLYERAEPYMPKKENVRALFHR